MKSIKILLLFLLGILLKTSAQQGNGGTLNSHKYIFLKDLPTQVFSKPNVEQLRAEDELTDHSGSAPWRFGYNNFCNLNMANSGVWFDLPDGGRLWMLRVLCEEALSVNLTFSEVLLPEGNELFVYTPKKDFILGKFTSEHVYQGKLGTELLPGSSSIIEYYVAPDNVNKAFGLSLTTVTHGYRTATEFQLKAFGSSGSCNNNVNCPIGASWVNERNSVVMLVSGSNGFCTGALVNNVLNDGKPYVLTADHCYSDPTSWIFRFNWQSPDCNNPASSPTFQSLSGSVLRARASASDFCLVEITGGLVGNTVPIGYSPYFAGWDNSGATPASAVGIHHPAGDIKKISFEYDPLISTTFGGSPANSHWGITGWDTGVTEPGSSGSPIFDQNHRVVGQLHGGASACGAPVLSDEYGKFSYSWNPAGSNSTNQLKFWLDPNSSGAQFVDGYDPTGASSVALDAGISSPQGVSGTLCTGSITPQVTIFNSGTDLLTSAVIQYGVDGVENQTYNWSGTLAQYQTIAVTLPSFTVGAGQHSFSASVTSPNSGTDENNLNNATVSSFTAVINGESVLLNFNLDCWGSETSWALADEVSGTTIFSGAGYQNTPAGDTLSEAFCLNEGCYVFTLNDTYGDGLTGCSQANGGNGNYQIAWNGVVMAELLEADANFGYQHQSTFCISLNNIQEVAVENIRIYPNPATESLTVYVDSEGMIEEISIYDASGKIHLHQKVAANVKESLNISSLSAGYYLIQIRTSLGSTTKEFVIQR